MTISIYTGTPGAGKTAMAVAELLDVKDRPIFVWGIPDLKIPHEVCPPVVEWTTRIKNVEDETQERPVFTFPPSALVLIDEAQNVFRPRGAGSKVPDHVAALETHRHGGIDFWLITQHPRLLDSNVRELCGRHVHIRNTALGRMLYEWPEAADPKSKTERDISASRRYTLPKKVFGLYKSSSLHIKQSRRLPNGAYILIVAVLLACYFGYSVYRNLSAIKEGKSGLPGQTTVQPGGVSAPTVDPVRAYVSSFQPRVGDYVHTAQVYDGLTQPRRVPVPAACVATETRCRCYTQDATPYKLAESDCRQIVAGGLFVAFEPNGAQRGRDEMPAASAASGGQGVTPSGIRHGFGAGLPESDNFVGVTTSGGAHGGYSVAVAPNPQAVR